MHTATKALTSKNISHYHKTISYLLIKEDKNNEKFETIIIEGNNIPFRSLVTDT